MRIFSSQAVQSVRGSCRWRRTFRRLHECGSRVRENGGDGILDTLLAFRRRIFWKQGQLLLIVGPVAVPRDPSHSFHFQWHDQVGHSLPPSLPVGRPIADGEPASHPLLPDEVGSDSHRACSALPFFSHLHDRVSRWRVPLNSSRLLTIPGKRQLFSNGLRCLSAWSRGLSRYF